MTIATAYWCILIAALLPYIWVGIAKTGATGYNNRNPRAWMAKQDGNYRLQRANAAHLNAFEAFAPFAAGVLMAQAAGVDHGRVALLAVAFVVLRLAHVPTGLGAALAALPEGTAVSASAATGVTYAALPADGAADALPRLREALRSVDGSAVVLRAPDALRGALDHWGPVGYALELMRRVKSRFDPEGRMSPGRFVGGI